MCPHASPKRPSLHSPHSKREALAVQRLAEENEHARAENERMVEAKRQQEEEAMDHKREMLESQLAMRQASAEENAATAERLQKMRNDRLRTLEETVRQVRIASAPPRVSARARLLSPV